MYDYFYGQQAELFSFYRVPKVLFTDEKFSNISSDAKLLYGIMLDRMNLSAKNGWVDELGRVYIIFTIEEVKGALGCAEKKAVKLLHELENKCGLIERKRIGLRCSRSSPPCRWRWGAGGPACTRWIFWWGFAAALACGWRCT